MTTYRRRLGAALHMIVMAVTVAALFSANVGAVENLGIGGKPANPDPSNPRSESIFVYELEPNTTITDAVEIINNSDETKTISVYAVDSVRSSDGAFACAQKADVPVGVGTWITLESEEVTIDPASSQDVAFTLTVPRTASAGEQNGCIAIQDMTAQQSSNDGVVLSFRSAIRVAVTVPGEITKGLNYVGPVVVTDKTNSLGLTVGLTNTGNVSLDTDLVVYVKNIFGLDETNVTGTYPVLANDQSTFNFEDDKPFWGGWYRVGSNATYNSDAEDSLGEDGVTSTVSAPEQWIYVTPQPVALVVEVIAGVAILLAIILTIFKKMHFSRTYRKAGTYKVREGDTLQKIAKTFDVNWKTIAKYNKLKAPYHLEAGDRLKIPGAKRPQ